MYRTWSENIPEVSLSELKGLIFDCDGVLLNSRMANVAFYNELRHMALLPPLSPEEEEFVHMATYAQALERIFMGMDSSRVAVLVEKLEGHFNYYDLLKVEDGLIPMLSWLHGFNFHMGICTNRVSPLEDFLSLFDLEKYFSPLQTASNSRPKPSPDGLLKVLKKWRLQPGEVAYIGDSRVDEAAATAAGVPFWSFRNQDLSASLHFDDFSELHGWLRLAVDKMP
ncbi:MAG: HAD family hydrolase [Deltaproteobacteria bacterium]|nr:HAD family hydrolase [Deltaproteobacteria bacterium]